MDKKRLIKRQRQIIIVFGITLSATLGFWAGITLSRSNTLCDNGYRYIHSFPEEMLLLMFGLVGLIFIVMIFMFIAIGKNPKPKSSDSLEQLEKLGKLKKQGLISEKEFEIEKKKLWDIED